MRVSFGLIVLILVGFELGVIPRMFDNRVVVEDAVLGAEFWIVKVDGEPTSRVRHGILVTKVPFALLKPGDRVLHVKPRDAVNGELLKIRARIEKRQRYRIEPDADGVPRLVKR